MAKQQPQIDASKNLDLNGVWVDGKKQTWAETFPRLSDEDMRQVREQRAAAELKEAA